MSVFSGLLTGHVKIEIHAGKAADKSQYNTNIENKLLLDVY